MRALEDRRSFSRLLGGSAPIVALVIFKSVDALSNTVLRATALQTFPKSVYVNLPFCRRRCFYCDFPIKVVGDRPGAAAEAYKPYVSKLLSEMRATAEHLGRCGLLPPTASGDEQGDEGGSGRHEAVGINTLYFGGGTPSLCPPELLGKVIETVRECFGIAPGAEITAEMDPGTFDEERLAGFLSLGINRVSMGVQSFDAGLLAACGRAHSVEDVYEALGTITKAGVENFSIDLISGLPDQTMEQWSHTLSETISTGAAHVSVYDLQVETGTPFGGWYTAGQAPLPTDDSCAEMYRLASKMLGDAGYGHYEISNYARPGCQSRHNRAYWENVPFLAFGNGAASYVGGKRFSRPRRLPEYYTWVERLAREGWTEATASRGAEMATEPVKEAETKQGGRALKDEISIEDQLLDVIMLGFRLREGVDLDALAATYGDLVVRGIEAGVAEGIERGWVVRDPVDGASVKSGGRHREHEIRGAGRGGLRLSDPDGFLFSNSVISSVFCELQSLGAMDVKLP